MTKAVEAGMPKLRIEEAAARRQAAHRPRRGGRSSASTSTSSSDEDRVDVLDIDNDVVRESAGRAASTRSAGQPRRGEVRARRSKALGEAARDGTGNLLDAVDRGDAGARHGRRDLATLEGVFGRHQADIRSISGVYAGD